MKLSYKLSVASLLGLGAVTSLFLFNSFTKNYFAQRNGISLEFKAIEVADRKLDYQILNNSFFLYTNQDDVNQKIKEVQYATKTLYYNPHLLEGHPETRHLLQKYTVLLDQKIQTIYEFQTFNTVIKNTSTALLVLQQHLIEEKNIRNHDEQKLLEEINRISGSILLAKNGMDANLMASLHLSTKKLSHKHFHDPKNEELLQRALQHFAVIQQFFPLYINAFNQIHNPKIAITLANSQKMFLDESNNELEFINYFSYILVILFILTLAIIIHFLFRTEREIRLDTLTHLKNRKAYEERISRKKNLALILININKFKHYNDFYGIKSGDRLLIETAHNIRHMKFSGVNPTYYRLGADDFGILFELSSNQNLESFAQEVLSTFSQMPITIDDEIRTPSISIAASDSMPLLETADMALKSKKQSNLVIYHNGLNLRKIILDNMTKVHELKSALGNNRILPYFQPIVNLSTLSVTKHEVLARIVMEDGSVRSIFPYLHIAKESNLYHALSRTIITKSFEVIAQNSGDFSINLSIDDIVDEETTTIICQMLRQYGTIGQRIIFEILESEAIEDYEKLTQFITLMRQYGCRIAIDDFGSGYSNFAHILNLSVDILKIDGSLIRYLDTNEKAITIVETILSFATRAAIETVAEFVHNEAVADIVKRIGVHSAQGFYFYEPAPKPIAP